jgi:hypothetical protein
VDCAVKHACLIAGLVVVSAVMADSPPAERRNFVACPILQDTATVPCWLADFQGERYFLGIQTDSGGWSPPWLGHKVLVEGKIAAAGSRICGGIPLTSQYLASSLPSGSAEGEPLPNPPVVSVMRELDASCNTLLPADPRFHISGRRGPGPNTAESALRRPPTAAPPPAVQAPFQPRTFTLTYEFDSELATRTIAEALKAVQYSEAVRARSITITGYRGATLLSDGTLLPEIPAIGRLRAEELLSTVRKLGIAPTTALSAGWISEPEAANGISDPDHRRAEILVTP